MTIPQWLESTDMTTAEIAKECRVDDSQISRWKSGEFVPQGFAMAKVLELAKGKITADEIPFRKRGQKAKAPRRRRAAAVG